MLDSFQDIPFARHNIRLLRSLAYSCDFESYEFFVAKQDFKKMHPILFQYLWFSKWTVLIHWHVQPEASVFLSCQVNLLNIQWKHFQYHDYLHKYWFYSFCFSCKKAYVFGISSEFPARNRRIVEKPCIYSSLKFEHELTRRGITDWTIDPEQV